MIRFSTIGTNFIVEKFLEAAQKCAELEYSGAYSRSKEKAKKIADSFGAKKIYTDLNALANDSDIDAVYIASPNSLHCEQSVLMLSHKKHVLCEKTIASNSKELEFMLKTAKDNNVVILEGMRSAFDPGFLAIQESLPKIGKIKNVSFQYCQYSSRYDNFKKGIIENAFNPTFSAGALMDIGVYCVHPMVKLFGLPNKIQAQATILENGIDGSGKIIAQYDEMQAELVYSKISDSSNPSKIEGENGTITIKTIPNPCEVKIFYETGEKKEEEVFSKKEEWNLHYEIEEWVRLIKTNPINPHNPNNIHSQMSLKIMDEARTQTGIKFPVDDSSVSSTDPSTWKRSKSMGSTPLI